MASAECTETIILLTFLFWLSSIFLLGSRQVCSSSLHDLPSGVGGDVFLSSAIFLVPLCVCFCYYASRTTKLVSESAANRLLILLRGDCAEDSKGLFLVQACGALEGNGMEGMKCYSGLRCLALLNYPVHGPAYRPVQRPVHRPVHRPVYRTHFFACVQKKRKHTPLNTPVHQGQCHPYTAYRGSIQGAIQGGNPILPQPHESAALIFPLFT